MDNNRIKNVPLVTREEHLKFIDLYNNEDNEVQNNEDNVVQNNEDNEVQNFVYYENVRNPRLFKSRIVAISLTASVIVGAFGIAKYIDDKVQAANEEIIYVADVHDTLASIDEGVKVMVQANGVAFYEDEDGNKFVSLSDISAEDMARMTGYQGELANSKGPIR